MHYLEYALFGAIQEKNYILIKELIATIDYSSRSSNPIKANGHAVNKDKQTFLQYALQCNDEKAFHILLPYYELEEEILKLDNNDRSLFWWAANSEHLKIAQEILDYYIKSANQASEKTLSEDFLLLIKADKEGITPLHLAAKKQSSSLLSSILSLLKENNLNKDIIDQQDEKFNSPLHLACRYNRFDNIKSLFEAGANIYLSNYADESFLIYLQKNPFLMDNWEIELKRKLLNQLIATALDLDDQNLKDFIYLLALKISLLDALKVKIKFNYTLAKPLDPKITEILYPTDYLPYSTLRVRQVIADGKKIDEMISNISEYIKNIKQIESNKKKQINMLFLYGISLSAILILAFGLFLFIGIGVLAGAFPLLLLMPIVITGAIAVIGLVAILPLVFYLKNQLMKTISKDLIPCEKTLDSFALKLKELKNITKCKISDDEQIKIHDLEQIVQQSKADLRTLHEKFNNLNSEYADPFKKDLLTIKDHLEWLKSVIHKKQLPLELTRIDEPPALDDLSIPIVDNISSHYSVRFFSPPADDSLESSTPLLDLLIENRI